MVETMNGKKYLIGKKTIIGVTIEAEEMKEGATVTIEEMIIEEVDEIVLFVEKKCNGHV